MGIEFKKLPKTNYAEYYKGKTFEDLIKAAAQVYSCYENMLYCRDQGKFYDYKNGIYKEIHQDQIIQNIRSHEQLKSYRTLNIRRCKEIIENMKCLPEARYCNFDDFDQDNIINFKNCLYNISENKSYPHNPEVICLIQLPYEYNEKAECPLFLEAINEILMNDQQKINLLQEYFGYCFTRHCDYEKSLFLYGESRTGKSLVLETIQAVIGHENVSSVSIDDLRDQNSLSNLIGKYVNVCDETEKNDSIPGRIYKIITSGQVIEVKKLYSDKFSTRILTKLFFSGNHIPKIKDTSLAVYERFMVIEFSRYFKQAERDPKLKKKIIEKECSGIFNWAMEGLKRLTENNKFSNCDATKIFLDELQKENNPIRAFADEKICVHEDSYLTHDDVFQCYLNWAMKNNIKYTYTKKEFNKEFHRVFIEVTHRGKRKSINGVNQYYWDNLKFIDIYDQVEKMRGEQINWEE